MRRIEYLPTLPIGEIASVMLAQEVRIMSLEYQIRELTYHLSKLERKLSTDGKTQEG
jgi:hypothetical protein